MNLLMKEYLMGHKWSSVNFVARKLAQYPRGARPSDGEVRRGNVYGISKLEIPRSDHRGSSNACRAPTMTLLHNEDMSLRGASHIFRFSTLSVLDDKDGESAEHAHGSRRAK